MALPFEGKRFDAATMALVIFFVPDPPKGVAEMARILAPGGIAAAYAWDMLGGGFPLEPIYVQMRALGLTPVIAPSSEASRIEVMRELWQAAGFEGVETRAITVERRFNNFEDFWTIAAQGPGFSAALAAMDPATVAQLKSATEASLQPDASGAIMCSARANAVKGRLPR